MQLIKCFQEAGEEAGEGPGDKERYVLSLAWPCRELWSINAPQSVVSQDKETRGLCSLLASHWL